MQQFNIVSFGSDNFLNDFPSNFVASRPSLHGGGKRLFGVATVIGDVVHLDVVNIRITPFRLQQQDDVRKTRCYLRYQKQIAKIKHNPKSPGGDKNLGRHYNNTLSRT